VKARKTNSRWWRQFSLRTLLLFVAVLGALSAWTALQVRRASDREKVVKTIEELGGFVLYDYEFDSSGAFRVGARLEVPQFLQNSLGVHVFTDVVQVIVAEDNFGRTSMTDSAMQELTNLRHLRVLMVSHSQGVTDEGLMHLAQLRELEELDLSGSSITDAGLARLSRCTGIQQLILMRTRITDAGLCHLFPLEQLRKLNLLGTDVTSAGVKRLQKALPKTSIVW